ncbi:unnamed protein product [Hymenolepis diminuta]|uniref:Reverse transcriptase domain-containing protein n=1 Tax=Hymenolepis diminuta TaxID=6216 RepID=A0A0R3SB69_HYMDI|nr:unnamed protein product [Hymenolepis diminuta]
MILRICYHAFIVELGVINYVPQRPKSNYKRGLCRVRPRQAHGILTTTQVSLELKNDTASDITIVYNEAWKILHSFKVDTVPLKNITATDDEMRIKEMLKRFTAVLEDTLGKRIRPISKIRGKLREKTEKIGIYCSYANCRGRVVVRKSNGLTCTCADSLKGPNSSLEDNNHLLPVIDTLFTILNGEKFFSKMELSDACLQVKVEQESHEVPMMGVFQYTRLTFGIKTAPVIFQHIRENMLLGLAGAVAYLDDIIVVGESEEELRGLIGELLEFIDKYGFHLRVDKCQFFLTSLKFLGSIFDSTGLHPNPDEIRAATKMLAPTNLGLLLL